jgi:ribonuclease E
MKKIMLINVMQPEECRIAILEDNTLQELYVERTSQESYVNNIYKGKVVNIEPSIQAAFVDFGIGRNGFLHVSDVASAYFKGPGAERGERGERGEGGNRGERPEGRGRGDRGRDDRGDRGGRGDRGDRGAPRPPRAFEPVPIPSGPPAEQPEYEEPAATASQGEDDDFGDFGAGLLDDTVPAAGRVIAAPGVDADLADAEEDVADAAREMQESTSAEEGEEAKPKRKRAATGRGRAKKADDEGEAKSKRKRVSKKKGEEEGGPAGEASADEGDDKPKYMGSAEHRTAGGDDEFVFDPMGPNDRFSGDQDTRPARAEKAEEFEEVAEEAAPDFDAVPLEEPVDVAPIEPGLENNFADADDDFAAPPSRDRGGRGDRDRDRGRGGRGDRGPGGRGGPRGSGGGGGGGFGRGRDGGMRPPPIETIFKRGQEVIVQVIKEGMGTKGPTLSTHISIAGRYLVLAPWLNRVAVSRKIDDEGTRHRLKEIMRELNAPKGIGFIIRTAAVDRNVQELQSDLAYLVRLWEVFTNRVAKRPGPIEVYRESDMVTRTIRDMFTSDIDAIVIDEPEAFSQAQEFMKIVMPRYADRLKLHGDAEPIFHHYGIEQEVHKLQDKKVPLPGGGSLIIEQTEALVAIDVNSGTFRVGDDAEETAYQTNLQAAKEIARQLRLRNLGGVVVNDFIDMKEERHRRNLEETLRKALKRDRSRTKILKTSAFGVIEMTRQRVQTSLKRTAYSECTHCRGTGLVKTPQSMCIDVMRMIQLSAHRKLARTVELAVHEDVAAYLLNKKRRELLKWEDAGTLTVSITGRTGVSPEFLEIRGLDNNGHEVPMASAPQPERRGERRDDREERGERGGDCGDRGGDRGGRGRDDRGGGGGGRGGRGGRGRGR